MPKETMPALDRLTLTHATPAELVARVAELDQGREYEVVIQPRKTRAERIADMERLADEMSAEAQAKGLTREKFADILGMSDEEMHNLFD